MLDWVVIVAGGGHCGLCWNAEQLHVFGTTGSYTASHADASGRTKAISCFRICTAPADAWHGLLWTGAATVLSVAAVPTVACADMQTCSTGLYHR